MKKDSRKKHTRRILSGRGCFLSRIKSLGSAGDRVLASALVLLLVFSALYPHAVPAAMVNQAPAAEAEGLYHESDASKDGAEEGQELGGTPDEVEEGQELGGTPDEVEEGQELGGTPDEAEEGQETGGSSDVEEEGQSFEETEEGLEKIQYLQGDLTFENSEYRVTLKANEEAGIPETARLAVRELEKGSDEYKTSLARTEEKIEETEKVSFARFFDITILGEDDKEIQPKDAVSVKISFANEVKMAKDTELVAVHLTDDSEEVIEAKEESQSDRAEKQVSEVAFEANSFSVYGLVGTQSLESKYITAEGESYTITVAYGPDAGIPSDAQLKVEEIKRDSDAYGRYFTETAEHAASGYDQYLNFVRFFDVSILVDGKEIEPEKAVKVTINCDGITDSAEDSIYRAIHFASKGTEVIEPEESHISDGEAEITYMQDGFSVVGISAIEQIGSEPLPLLAGATGDDVPEHIKTLTPNGDGSYKLSLSVTGSASSSTTINTTQANVILVFDNSNSMINNLAPGTNETRMAAAKRSVKRLVTNLMSNNTVGNPNAIQMSMISFNSSARLVQDWTTSASTLNSKIDGLGNSEGTNWEAALKAANNMESDDDPTYVIFVTDGRPTNYLNNSGNVVANYDNPFLCYSEARQEARDVVTVKGRTLYGIFAYGTGSQNYLDELINYAYNSSTAYRTNYFNATNTAALENALHQIEQTITTKFGFKNVSIRDGLTDMTSAALTEGLSDGFTYSRSGGTFGSGTAWLNAPAATYSNKTVQWNLSSLGTLDDGITYTVSFTVWPSQPAYDLVAALNNGKYTYDTLPEAQKKQIVQENGSYALKTNTEATVSYTKVKTVNGEETTYSPGVSAYKNPDPMPLVSDWLTIKKNWNDDTTSGANRPQSISIWVTEDGGRYRQVTLNNGNNWQQRVAVAPGIKVRPGAYETSFFGSNAGFLTLGHVYSAEEVDIDPRYEFSMSISTLHPMLDGLTTDTTTDIVDVISGSPWTGQAATLSATNTLKSRLKISKVVTTKTDMSDSISSDKTFKIKLTLKDSSGLPLSTVDYNGNDQLDPGELQYQIRNRINNSLVKSGKIVGGLAKLEITTEQYIDVLYISSGAVYEIKEEASDIPAGYQFLNVINGNGTIQGDTQTDVTVYNKRKPLAVELLKVDESDHSITLNGAQFALYQSNGLTPALDADGNHIGMATVLPGGGTAYIVTTEHGGKVRLGNLSEGSYILKEIQPPQGYKIMEPITINVTSTKVSFTAQGSTQDGEVGADGLTYTLTITNSTGAELPMTGGLGTGIYIWSGLLILMVTLLYGIILRRRRERRLSK